MGRRGRRDLSLNQWVCFDASGSVSVGGMRHSAYGRKALNFLGKAHMVCSTVGVLYSGGASSSRTSRRRGRRRLGNHGWDGVVFRRAHICKRVVCNLRGAAPSETSVWIEIVSVAVVALVVVVVVEERVVRRRVVGSSSSGYLRQRVHRLSAVSE